MPSNYKTKRPFRKSGNPDRRPPTQSVFLYSSRCCDVPAEKEPCIRTQESREKNEFSQSTLGTWACTRCRQKCSVTRTRRQVVSDAD